MATTYGLGDDSVVVKSGRDRDGRQIGRPSEHVIVRHNDMGGEDGIATVWLPVTDMGRALEFYGDTLGLDIEQQEEEWSMAKDVMRAMRSRRRVSERSMQVKRRRASGPRGTDVVVEVELELEERCRMWLVSDSSPESVE